MRIDKDYLHKAFRSNPIEIFLNILETDSGKVAIKRTSHVLKISLGIYIPLILLCIVLFIEYNYLALPFWLLVILSAFPCCKYIIIPLSERERGKIEENVRGKYND